MLKTKNTPTKTSIKPKITLTLTELNGILHAQAIQRKHQELIQTLLYKFGKTSYSPVKARRIWGKDTVSLSNKIIEMREE